MPVPAGTFHGAWMGIEVLLLLFRAVCPQKISNNCREQWDANMAGFLRLWHQDGARAVARMAVFIWIIDPTMPCKDQCGEKGIEW